MSSKKIYVVLDMDNTLLSMECLDAVIETALSAQLQPGAISAAMMHVDAEMDKGMNGSAKLSETIPARLRIAKKLGAPVRQEHFEIVSRIVPNTITQSIVTALRDECAKRKEHSIIVSIVSGGPQICVDAAVKELSAQLLDNGGVSIQVSGIGSTIALTEDGDLDSLHSDIRNSKIETIQALVKDPSSAVMLGDSSMDVEVYEKGVVHYFIAVGLWVRRPFLFDKAENRPYYLKVDERKELASALQETLAAMHE